jgi:hypothetical protein
VIDQPQTKITEEQQDNTNKVEDAMAVDETDKTNTEIQPETTPDVNKPLTASPIELEQKIEEPPRMFSIGFS